MLMYRVDNDKASPFPVECENPSWPHYDASGRKIFINTHFASIEETWAKLQSEADAGVRLGCSRVESLRSDLAKAEAELVNRTLRAEAVREARKDAERSTR